MSDEEQDIDPTKVIPGGGRRLVFCFDGSWNKLDTKKHPTNVVLIAESVKPVDQYGVDQLVYYDEGVGTASDETWRGGIFGKGLVQNIREAYRFLIFNYRLGDQIFVFGFSRGAFTARSFIGFIRAVGILHVNDANQITEAWKLYTENADRDADEPDALLEFRAKFCPNLCMSRAEQDWREKEGYCEVAPEILSIPYIGVWDTVGTLGWQALTAAFFRRKDKRHKAHDTQLSRLVQAGRHALALDERRVHFMPTLWRNVTQMNADAGANPYGDDAPFQQRWFAGDHGSVGGGGPERGLSNASLHWVLKGAVGMGLNVNLEGRSQLGSIRYNASAPLSNTPAEGLQVNKIGMHTIGAAAGWIKTKLFSNSRSSPEDTTELHTSVLRRWFLDKETAEGLEYRPAILDQVAEEIETQRDEFLPPDADQYPTYVVTPGRGLRSIAYRSLGDAERADEIFALNRDMIDHPDDIFPDDVLRMPKDADPSKVQPPTAISS